MHIFGNRGDKVFSRPGAKWKFWVEGRTFFNARAVCKHCRCMFMASTQTGVFTSADDEETLKFFLLTPLEFPNAMVR